MYISGLMLVTLTSMRPELQSQNHVHVNYEKTVEEMRRVIIEFNSLTSEKV